MPKLLETLTAHHLQDDQGLKKDRINSSEVEIDKLIPTMHLEIEP